jgi:hypothetical protein
VYGLAPQIWSILFREKPEVKLASPVSIKNENSTSFGDRKSQAERNKYCDS